MTDPLLFSRSVERSIVDCRITVLRRRVSASGPLAIILSDLAYGTRERDHTETLRAATLARVADANTGARS